MAFLIHAYRNRTTKYSDALYEADESTGVPLADTDVLRFKLGRGGRVLLDLDQDATSAGSVVTIDDRGDEQSASTNNDPANYTITLAAGDMKHLEPGAYSAELLVVDDDQDDAPLPVEEGTVIVHETMGGDVGL